jgi:tRNA modification GTPase
LGGSVAFSVETIAALATPAGISALALVRASGPQVRDLCQAIFGESPTPRQARRADYRDAGGAILDDVVYTYFQAPATYTGEDLVEIGCHGNPLICQKLLEDLADRGCRPACPGEFTQRAFLNGRMDLSQAEAVADLIHARSERALAAANQQLRGALGRRLESLTGELLNALAHVEAAIDFPEEDLPAADLAALATGLRRVQDGIAQLQATAPYGELLRDGLKTVILGEPNAGKSSLLNRLVGRERALVSAEPGTTRDYLEEGLRLGPHCINLTDTAGLNPSPAPLEQQGMARTLERAAAADLLLLVLDATRPPPPLPDEVRARLVPGRALVAVNKIDLVGGGAGPAAPAGLPVLRVSALTGAGCDELAAAIVRHAEEFRPDRDEELIAVNARHAAALARASTHLQAALARVGPGMEFELAAADLRGVVDAIGEISGKIDNELVLDRIFSTFCIGK